MTIKQYGSLTLDLNTVKQTYDSFGANLLIRLHDGNQITLLKEWHSQFTQDYQEFTLNKRLKVIKDAFDYVFDSDIKVISEGLNCSKPIIDIGYIKFDYLNLVIDKEGGFTGDNFKGKLTEFNIKTSDENIWLRYARQINQAYLDSIVDPVKVANQVLKSRKLDKEWVAEKLYNSAFVLTNKDDKNILVYKVKLGLAIEFSTTKNILDYYPTTNSEWVTVIELALDKYYDLNKVNLKLMLGKALKDNGLVAEIVSIFYYEKSLYINVSIPKNKSIQWVKSLDGTINVYLLTPNNKEAFLRYSTTNVEDWQTIFSDSLAQYKKLNTTKLTELALINCLEDTIKLPVSGVFSTSSSLVGSLRVTWNDVVIEWILKEESVEVYWVGNCPLFNGVYSKPTTLEEWGKLFKETFGSVTTTIQKIIIHKMLFEGTAYNPEPTLLDLLKKAFPKFTWVHEKKDKYHNTFIGTSFFHKIKVVSLSVNDDILQFDLSAKDVGNLSAKDIGRIHHFATGLITKQKLANSTGWQEWLNSVIESKANLDNLVSTPTVKDYLNKDVW